MLNWPEGQSLNLTCLVEKRYMKDTSEKPSEYTVRIPFTGKKEATGVEVSLVIIVKIIK